MMSLLNRQRPLAATITAVAAIVLYTSVSYSKTPLAVPGNPRIPFPNSIIPSEVVSNIKAIAQLTSLADFSSIPDLKGPPGNLLARRVLQVRAENGAPAHYLVAELEDLSGNAIANVALTAAGELLALQDTRGHNEIRRPMDLGDVAARVKSRRGKPPTTLEYVYFTNIAERGVSLFRPLVAATTERGIVYFSSDGDVFAEAGSPIDDESVAPGSKAQRTLKTPSNIRTLVRLGKW